MLTCIAHGYHWIASTKSMLTCITHGYHWIASSESMLTWITTIIVFSWFCKVCWLVSPRGIAELLHPKVCWLVSPKGITELLHPKVCWLESPPLLCFLDFEKYVDLYHPWVSLNCFIRKYVDLNHHHYCVFLILKSMLTCITHGCYCLVYLNLSLLSTSLRQLQSMLTDTDIWAHKLNWCAKIDMT